MKALRLSRKKMIENHMVSPLYLIMNASSHGLFTRFVGCMYAPSLRHEHFPQKVSQSMNEPSRLMRASHLLPGRRNGFIIFWFLVRFIPLKHPKRCLSQMPAYCYDRLGMSPALHDTPVESHNMTVGPATLIEDNDVRCFNQGPLQIAIHIRTNLPEANPATTLLYPRDGTPIACQLLSSWKSINLSNLQSYYHCQDRTNSREGHPPSWVFEPSDDAYYNTQTLAL